MGPEEPLYEEGSAYGTITDENGKLYDPEIVQDGEDIPSSMNSEGEKSLDPDNEADWEVPDERTQLRWEINAALESGEINDAQYSMLSGMIQSTTTPLETTREEFMRFKDITLLKNFPNG